MGYGGALIYSGLARNLKKRFPEKKVVFVYPLNLDELWWRHAARDRVVWKHNNDIDLVTDRLRWFLRKHAYPAKKTFAINIDDPRYFYWLKDHGDRIEYKHGQHAIQIACDVHGIKNCELRSKLVLTKEEEVTVEELLKRNMLKHGEYICIEPATKDTFSPNKAWFFDRWQELVWRLQPQKIIQIGVGGSPVLKGVINLVGQTTFRETGGILQHTKLVVSAEGGLPHVAAAVGAPAVVLLSNVLPPELMSYPQHTNLYADQTCVCRGLKTPCPRGRQCMAKITVEAVYQAIVEKLNQGVT